MTPVTGASLQDIATFASSGVMGLSALFLIAVLTLGKTQSTVSTWAAIIVIVVAAGVQLGTKYMDSIAKPHSDVSITFTPDPSGIAQFLPADSGAPIKARPRLWLEDGAPKCNPNDAAYNPQATDCPVFAQAFPINTDREAIHVSVDDVMQELRERVIKLSSVNTAIIGGQVRTPAANTGPRQLPIGDNAALQ